MEKIFFEKKEKEKEDTFKQEAHELFGKMIEDKRKYYSAGKEPKIEKEIREQDTKTVTKILEMALETGYITEEDIEKSLERYRTKNL